MLTFPAPTDPSAQYPKLPPKAPPTGTALSLRKTAAGCTPLQILESRKHSSRPAQTQTFECYSRNQTSPRPASANPASPGRAPPSPPSNVSCTPQDSSRAAPLPLPPSLPSAPTRRRHHPPPPCP